MTLILRSVVMLFLVMSSWASTSVADSRGSPFLNISFQAEPTSPSDARLLLQSNLVVAGEVTTTLRLPPELGLTSGELVRVSSVGEGGLVATEWTLDASQDGYYSVELVISVEFDDSSNALLYGTTVAFNQYLEFDGGSLTHSGEEPLGQYTARGLADEQIFTHTEAQAYIVGQETLSQEMTAPWIVVAVSGRIVYGRTDACYNQDPSRGVPGVLVYLDWDGGSSPNAMYTPYYGGGAEGIDYAKTDMDGHFGFLFQFSSAVPANDIASFISVYSTRSNAATKNYRFADDNFFVQHDQIDISTSTYLVQDDDVQVEVPLNDGAALRSFYRARQYSIDVLGYTPPFLRHYIWGSGRTAYWSNGDGHTSVRHVDFVHVPLGDPAFHEYGHFVDHMWGGLVTDGWDDDHWFDLSTDWGTAWKEGWAEYFSAVVYEHFYALELTEVDRTGWSSLYQFLDRENAQSRLDNLSGGTDRTRVEGAVASFLYSLHDGYDLRANGYVGDNDDVTVSPSLILNACEDAENQSATNFQLVPKLNDLIKAQVNSATGSSVQALYDFYLLDTGFPRSATPTVLDVTRDGGEPMLAWNNNVVADVVQIPSAQCLPYSIWVWHRNPPSGYRVYRRPGDQAWGGTLAGYDLLTTVSNATFAWVDSEPLDGPASYVVVAQNSEGPSRPQAEQKLIPPTHFDTPDVGSVVSDIVSISGTVNSLAQISGYTVAAELDSFSVAWGIGAEPASWSGYGIDYLVSRTSSQQHQSLATWNTGVVATGTCTIRITAHYGSQVFEATRSVDVQHQSTTVSTSGGAFTSIQSAMNWAQMGDTIRVIDSGPFVQSHSVRMKPTVVLRAEVPDAMLSCAVDSTTILIENHDYPCVIDGLTITHEPGISVRGVGVSIINASPVIKNSVVREIGGDPGIGIRVSGASAPVFENVSIHDNYDSGVKIVGDENAKPIATFTNCSFLRNNANNGGTRWQSGAGVDIRYVSLTPIAAGDPKTTFTNCLFQDNYAGEDAHGAALSVVYAGAELTGCTFVGNRSVGPWVRSAVGVQGNSAANLTLENCTIVDNPESGGYQTGGVYLQDGAYVDVLDCIIANNGGPAIFSFTDAAPDLGVSNAVVFGNGELGSPPLFGPTDAEWPNHGALVVHEDPAFCDPPNGVYTVSAASPCVAGVTFQETIGAHDVGCIPDAGVSVVKVVREPGIPDSLVFGCPQGDADGFQTTVDFSNTGLTRELGSGELVLEMPYVPHGIYSDHVITADGPVPLDSLKTTVSHDTITGIGVDTLGIYLNGYRLAQSFPIERRGPDYNGDGVVDLADYSFFGEHWTSMGGTYSDSSDFNDDGVVDLFDYAAFGNHWQHEYPNQALGSSPALVRASSGQVRLSFVEEDPTVGQRILKAYVALDNVEHYDCAVIVFKNENAMLEFSSWHADSDYPRATMCAPIVRDGQDEIILGVMGGADVEGQSISLGYFEAMVNTAEELTLTEEDYALVSAQLLERDVGDGPATVLGISGMQMVRELSPPVYRDELAQNYPNPFNPTTTIAFSIASAAQVELVIYDVTGARVRTLLDERRESNRHRVVWDGRDERGSSVASGVYFYRLTAGDFRATRKMVLIR